MIYEFVSLFCMLVIYRSIPPRESHGKENDAWIFSLWDASSPNHTGRVGNFEYFTAFFNKFLNAE